jgi:hypothetical protein
MANVQTLFCGSIKRTNKGDLNLVGGLTPSLLGVGRVNGGEFAVGSNGAYDIYIDNISRPCYHIMGQGRRNGPRSVFLGSEWWERASSRLGRTAWVV